MLTSVRQEVAVVLALQTDVRSMVMKGLAEVPLDQAEAAQPPGLCGCA